MNQNPFSGIKRVILVSMILLPCVSFIASLCIGYYYFATSLQENIVSRMTRIIEDHRQMIESFLTERIADLSFVGDVYSFDELSNAEGLTAVFHHLQRKSNAFTDLGVFDEAGLHVAYHGPYRLTGKVYKDAPWFRVAMKDGNYISDIFLGYRNYPHFIIATAREEDRRKWVIRATIDTPMFNALVEKIRIGKTGEAFLLNADGLLQTAPRSGGELMDKHADSFNYPESLSGVEIFLNKNSAGETYLNATTWLHNQKWLLVVRQEKSDAFKALRSAVFLIVLISVIGGGAIISTALYLTNHIIGRMERMSAEKSQLSQQLIGASRLAELGEMAAGFAHEINNPLQIIKSEQSLMDIILSEMKEAGQISESDSLSEFIDSMNQIKLQVSRCADITQSILKFGRQNEPKPKHIDLNYFIPEIIAMVSKKADVHGIAIEQDLSKNTPTVYGDGTQLHQVMLNLLNNAMDAIVEKHGSKGGCLTVSAGPGPDGNVHVSVQDNGCGIVPENLDKIFSPFFTTKPVGKGTGLGLSVCYGIIKDMGGTMKVSSEKDVGTTFHIQLPASDGDR